MLDPTWPERYHLGLVNIKTCVASALFDAGAIIGDQSILHPRLPPKGVALPAELTLTVVPLNGPRIADDFTRDEVAACWEKPTGPVLQKVERYVQAFRDFRSSTHRNVRPLAKAAPASLSGDLRQPQDG